MKMIWEMTIRASILKLIKNWKNLQVEGLEILYSLRIGLIFKPTI
jgi:hypothetical protein